MFTSGGFPPDVLIIRQLTFPDLYGVSDGNRDGPVAGRDHTMTRETGAESSETPFSGDDDGGNGTRTSTSGGCRYATPGGRCGDDSTLHEVGGVQVELCPSHLEAALEENGASGGAA